jgi:DNA-binding NarL/FixJ family response regulator
MQSGLQIPELLLVDYGARAVRHTAVLAQQGNVVATATLEGVEDFLRRREVDVVITEYRFHNGTALDICRVAASLSSCPSVLVTGADISQAAELIVAGCHGILLKPVETSLLCNRVTRLIRARRVARLPTAGTTSARASTRGTNQYWSEMSCPRCGANGVYSFEHSSYRRAWYACTSCRHGWLDARREPRRRRNAGHS